MTKTQAKRNEAAADVIRRVVAFLHSNADSGSEPLYAEALRYAANEIEAELRDDEGDLAFLPD